MDRHRHWRIRRHSGRSQSWNGRVRLCAVPCVLTVMVHSSTCSARAKLGYPAGSVHGHQRDWAMALGRELTQRAREVFGAIVVALLPMATGAVAKERRIIGGGVIEGDTIEIYAERIRRVW